MKLSTSKEFEGYNMELGKGAIVRFDGLTLENCVFADEEKRMATALDLDMSTRFRVPVHRKYYGDVRIILGDKK